MLEHMNKLQMINHNHHAYLPGHSTTTTLLQLSDAIMTATDKSMITTLVTVDESAAFDCVSIPILIEKMKRYGFGTRTTTWLQNYLTGRQHFIAIGDKCSKTVSIERGVPQGSVLGPLLYTLYTNELPEAARDPQCHDSSHKDPTTLFPPNCLTCGQIPCYADDATLVVPTNNRENAQISVDKTLERVRKFLNSNELSINKAKTNLVEVMVSQKRARIGGLQPTIDTVDAEGKYITIVPQQHTRLLGANYSQNMSWDSHLIHGSKALIPEIRKTLGGLKHISKEIPANSRITLANGLIISRIQYVIALWGATGDKNLRKVQATMNCVARWATNSSKNIRTIDLMKRCNWFTVYEMEEIATVIALWKVLNLQIPRQIYEKLTITENMKVTIDKTKTTNL